MDVIAYQAAKIFAWLLPLSLIVVGGIALAKGYRWAGASFLCSGFRAWRLWEDASCFFSAAMP